MMGVRKIVRLISLLPTFFFSTLLYCQETLKLAPVFADHMVLQREMKVPVWGSAKPGDKVKVGFNNTESEGVADAEGNWKIFLDPMPANVIGQDLKISAAGNAPLMLHDVLVGEVWLCSGQSNMRMEMKYRDEAIAGVTDWQNEIKKANYPLIRLYNRFRKKGAAQWEVCDSNAVKLFSAVAYYFGSSIFNDLKIPIGLLHESAGGTSIQKWIPDNYFKELPWAKQYLDFSQYIPWADPGSCYKNFIEPLKGFGIRGAIWYQGESNANSDVHGYSYRYLLPLLIQSWRKEWGQGNFPFAIVQLPVWEKSNAFRFIREAELNTAKNVPNTGMVVSYDNDSQRTVLHPGTKKPIGQRLGLWAQSVVYNKSGSTFDSPLYDTHERNEKGITVYFSHVKKLKISSSEILHGFSVASADREFKPAIAMITGKNSVTISSTAVKDPVAVRYAWGENIQPGNLTDETGLPASPFRTDEWGNDTLQKALEAGEELQLIKMGSHFRADATMINEWMPAPQPARTELKNNNETVTLSTNRAGKGGIQSPYLLQVDFSKNPVIKLQNLQLETAEGWSIVLMNPSKDQFILKDNSKETGTVIINIPEIIQQINHKKNSFSMKGRNDIVLFFYANSVDRKGSLAIDGIEIVYETK